MEEKQGFTKKIVTFAFDIALVGTLLTNSGTIWMMVIPVKIAAVSYLNTVPFVYGIKHADNLCAELLLSPPALCAEAFRRGDVDIALVPIGALKSLSGYTIVTDYCLGSAGGVRTVTLMSNSPLGAIRRVWLDGHSRTSALLVQILAAELWNIKPEWCDMEDYSVVEGAQEGDAFLLIGDKVFDNEDKFKYIVDLSDEWKRLTDMPMVFAVWIAREGTDPEVLDALEGALTLGVERIWEAIVEEGHEDKPFAYEYLTERLDFLFDHQKHKALELFWEKGQKFVPHANPG